MARAYWWTYSAGDADWPGRSMGDDIYIYSTTIAAGLQCNIYTPATNQIDRAGWLYWYGHGGKSATNSGEGRDLDGELSWSGWGRCVCVVRIGISDHNMIATRPMTGSRQKPRTQARSLFFITHPHVRGGPHGRSMVQRKAMLDSIGHGTAMHMAALRDRPCRHVAFATLPLRLGCRPGECSHRAHIYVLCSYSQGVLDQFGSL